MMKKLLFIPAILCLILMSSCGGDDNEDLNVDNTISIGSETYEISNGAYIDFEVTEGVYEASFALSDATLTPNSSSFSFSSSASLVVIFSLASVGNTLAEGTYLEGDILNAAAGKVYLQPVVQVNGTTLSVTGGTIQLRGSAPNFTIQLDLDLSSGEKLSGGYSGTFISQ